MQESKTKQTAYGRNIRRPDAGNYQQSHPLPLIPRQKAVYRAVIDLSTNKHSFEISILTANFQRSPTKCIKWTCNEEVMSVCVCVLYNHMLVRCHTCFMCLTSCTATRSKLNFSNSLATVFREPVLQRILTFHIPNLMSVFRSLGRSKGSVQLRGTG